MKSRMTVLALGLVATLGIAACTSDNAQPVAGPTTTTLPDIADASPCPSNPSQDALEVESGSCTFEIGNGQVQDLQLIQAAEFTLTNIGAHGVCVVADSQQVEPGSTETIGDFEESDVLDVIARNGPCDAVASLAGPDRV